MNITLEYVDADKLTAEQNDSINWLNQECFADVSQDDVEQDFIAEPFGFLFASFGGVIIGRLALFERKIEFDGTEIKLGGMGGVCVGEKARHKGIATVMLKKGLDILREHSCDLACLNVDLDKKVYGVYERVGFWMMDRDISFENVHGEKVTEPGTMFAPICSQEKYDLVMNSESTFHYGRGYW